LGDGFSVALVAQNTTAMWNANQLHGFGVSSSAPTNGQVLTYNGTNWAPATPTILNAGDGIDLSNDTIIVDVTDLIGTGLSEDASNNLIVSYGSAAGTAVEGNQTATITAGNGLSGGISADALGDGFTAMLSVDYGTTTNTAVEGSQTATITAGTGLTGGITADTLGDGFSATLNADNTTALWNAKQSSGPQSKRLITLNL